MAKRDRRALFFFFVGEANLWIEFCNATKWVSGTYSLFLLVTEVVAYYLCATILNCRRSDSVRGGSLRTGLAGGDDSLTFAFRKLRSSLTVFVYYDLMPVRDH